MRLLARPFMWAMNLSWDHKGQQWLHQVGDIAYEVMPGAVVSLFVAMYVFLLLPAVVGFGLYGALTGNWGPLLLIAAGCGLIVACEKGPVFMRKVRR